MVAKTSRVCFPFVGDDVGGSHISALGLVRHLDRDRFEPVILVEKLDGKIANLFQREGCRVEQSPGTVSLPHGLSIGLRRMAGTIPSLYPFARTLREAEVDIVHTNDGRTHAAWALAAKIAGRKLVWHHRGAPNAAGLRLLAPLLADRVISVSAFASGSFARARVIHSPFDSGLDFDRAAARAMVAQALAGGPMTHLIGYFGAFIARKRPLLFVDAIAAIRRRHPCLDVRGLMFGEPFDVTNEIVLAHARKAGAADAIHLMGYRSPGPRWLAGCDLLMVPAVSEPFGRTLIEAMLVGTPVVATRSGGNEEALRNGALGALVPPESAEALADAAISLLTDKARREKLSQLAREDARARFSEERHAEAVMAVYDELLASSGLAA